MRVATMVLSVAAMVGVLAAPVAAQDPVQQWAETVDAAEEAARAQQDQVMQARDAAERSGRLLGDGAGALSGLVVAAAQSRAEVADAQYRELAAAPPQTATDSTPGEDADLHAAGAPEPEQGGVSDTGEDADAENAEPASSRSSRISFDVVTDDVPLPTEPDGQTRQTRDPAAGGGSVVVRYCPVDDPVFTDDWGAPRPGGRSHQGNDLFAPHGTPIRAVDDGVVDYSRHLPLGGLSVAYTTDTGARWFVTHNSWNDPDLSPGDRVEAGQVIAQVGNTGNARTTPPHAHVELRPGGEGTTRVNPYPHLVAACR